MRFIPLLEEQGLMRQVGPWACAAPAKTTCAGRKAGVALAAWQIQPFGRADPGPGRGGTDRAHTGRDRHAARTLELEGHRDLRNGRPGRTSTRCTGSRARHPPGDRRLRHRLFLARLSETPADQKLKIDRSFVKDVPGDADDEAITRRSDRPGQDLNLDIIAEGGAQGLRRFPAARGLLLARASCGGKPMPEDEIVPGSPSTRAGQQVGIRRLPADWRSHHQPLWRPRPRS